MNEADVIPLPPWDDLLACSRTLTELPQGASPEAVAIALVGRWQERPPAACIEIPWRLILAAGQLYEIRVRCYADLRAVGHFLHASRPWPSATAPWLLPTWCPHQINVR